MSVKSTAAVSWRQETAAGARARRSARDVEPVGAASGRAKAKGVSGGKRRAQSRVVAGVTITNPDRVLFPEGGFTKGDLAGYYESVAELMLPYVVDRPLSTVRCPGGRSGPCFFQKHPGDTFSEPVGSIRLVEKSGPAEYLCISSAEGLITLAQFGVIEIHPWGSRGERLEQPDLLTFDLDPGPSVGLEALKAAARRVREVLAELGLESFVKTSGGKGLHVNVPLAPRAGWAEAKAFAAGVARYLAVDEPDRYVDNMSKQKREGKIFVDYLRNGRGATSVAPYSARARMGAPVSMPISWLDLPRLKSPSQYTIENAAGSPEEAAAGSVGRFPRAKAAAEARALQAGGASGGAAGVSGGARASSAVCRSYAWRCATVAQLDRAAVS